MEKLNPREIAQASALRGDVEAALTALSTLQQQGDIAAQASLAEIAAFQGKWDAVVRHASVVAAHPTSIRTLNVYQDMLRLIALAGLHLGRWDEARSAGESALAALGKVQMLPGYEVAAAGLLAFAASRGQVSHGWRPGRYDDRPEAERIAKYDSGIAKFSGDKKKRFKTLQERRDHFIGIAKNCLYYRAAVSLADEGGLPELFDSVVFVASGLVRLGRDDEAWTALRSKLGRWWPVEATQIAPVELLADDALRPLMTPERCEEVLRTPRGSMSEET